MTTDAAAVGVLGLLISTAFAAVPSVWYDEAATISASTRSWAELWRMLGNVDAVHGLYYAGMHLWFDLVGYSPLTLRLPSAVATAVAAALIVVLVRSQAPRRTAVIAGVLFCLLPRVTWMGGEGRSYALTATLAVAVTSVFLAAWRSGNGNRSTRIRWWILYGAVAALSTAVFAYLALLVVSHGVTAVWTRWSQHRGTASAAAAQVSLHGWLLASAAAGLALIPFGISLVMQAGQVDWIDPISPSTAHGVFITAWFYKNPAFAAVAWTLIVAGIVLLQKRARSSIARESPGPTLLTIALPWLVVPTLGLVLASILISPLYSPRYLSFSAPAAAILAGVAVSAFRKRWRIAVALLVILAIALPQIVAQRMPEAKQESSWSEVAALVAQQRSLEPAATREAIIYGPVRRHASATTRVIAYAYPDAFEGMTDVKLKTPAGQTGQLWETRYPFDAVRSRLDGVGVVWLVTSDKQDWRPGVTRQLGTLDYTLMDQWNLTGVNVLRYEK